MHSAPGRTKEGPAINTHTLPPLNPDGDTRQATPTSHMYCCRHCRRIRPSCRLYADTVQPAYCARTHGRAVFSRESMSVLYAHGGRDVLYADLLECPVCAHSPAADRMRIQCTTGVPCCATCGRSQGNPMVRHYANTVCMALCVQTNKQTNNSWQLGT